MYLTDTMPMNGNIFGEELVVHFYDDGVALLRVDRRPRRAAVDGDG